MRQQLASILIAKLIDRIEQLCYNFTYILMGAAACICLFLNWLKRDMIQYLLAFYVNRKKRLANPKAIRDLRFNLGRFVPK